MDPTARHPPGFLYDTAENLTLTSEALCAAVDAYSAGDVAAGASLRQIISERGDPEPVFIPDLKRPQSGRLHARGK